MASASGVTPRSVLPLGSAPASQQELRAGQVIHAHAPVQRRRAELTRRIGIRAALHQQTHGAEVAIHRGIGERARIAAECDLRNQQRNDGQSAAAEH